MRSLACFAAPSSELLITHMLYPAPCFRKEKICCRMSAKLKVIPRQCGCMELALIDLLSKEGAMQNGMVIMVMKQASSLCTLFDNLNNDDDSFGYLVNAPSCQLITKPHLED